MKLFAQHLQQTKIGAPVVCGNLAMFPLFCDGVSDGVSDGGDFLSFDEAHAKEWVTVSEVSEAGSVPTLLLDNRATRPVFLLDGEQLTGAKQNRTVNLSLLIAAGVKTEIPVSCVEAGRWSRRSRNFKSSRYMHFNRGRREKMAQVNRNMRAHNSRRSDQGKVWSSIEEKRAAMHAHAPSAAMDDIYAQSEARLENYARNLTAQEGQTGAVFAIDGRISGFDLFSASAQFGKYLPKLIGSHALDALETFDADKKPQTPPAHAQVEKFLRSFGLAAEETSAAVGMGRDVRVENAEVVGAGLVVEEGCVHLAGFPKEGGE